jgi:hypothetical protein
LDTAQITFHAAGSLMLQNILQEGEEWGIIALCSRHYPA